MSRKKDLDYEDSGKKRGPFLTHCMNEMSESGNGKLNTSEIVLIIVLLGNTGYLLCWKGVMRKRNV